MPRSRPWDGDSDLVELTPYVGGRCACDHPIRLRKQDVEVEPTDQIVACCGTTRRVFRVQIKPGTQVPPRTTCATYCAPR